MNISTMRIKSFSVLTVLCAVFLSLAVSVVYGQDDPDTFITVFNDTYYGHYDGDETFTSTSGNGTLELTGSWKEGTPDGGVIITLADGTVIEAAYANGAIDGNVKETAPDGSYKTYSCSKGVRTGMITEYNEAGEVTGYDHYFQSGSVKEIIAQAETPEYHALTAGGFSYNNPVRVEGTVLSAYDNDELELIVLQDADEHICLITTFNNGMDPNNQGIVPNVAPGQELVMYAYYLRSASLYSLIAEEAYGLPLPADDPSLKKQAALSQKALQDSLDAAVSRSNQELQSPRSSKRSAEEAEHLIAPLYGTAAYDICPVLLAVYAEDPENTAGLPQGELSYEDILHDPYFYAQLSCSTEGTVIHASADPLAGTCSFFIENADHEIYCVKGRISGNSAYPLTGDHVTVEGRYSGNFKVKYKDPAAGAEELPVYIIYPLIEAAAYTVD